VPGTCVTVTLEGCRPLLAEVHGLRLHYSLRPLSTVPQFPYSLARLSESCQAMPAKLVHDEPLRLITVISFRIVALG
jgi:hypothetical protein